MRVTTPAFAAMTSELRAVAEECCRGRIVAAVEGGYDLQALGASLDASIESLAGDVIAPHWPSSGIASSRAQTAVGELRQVLAPYWTL